MNNIERSLKNFDEFNRIVQANACAFQLLFDRRKCLIKDAPAVLRDYVSGTHYLSTKQVASATLLRAAGSFSIKERIELLQHAGFKIRSSRTYDGHHSGSTLTDVPSDETGPYDEFALAAEDHSHLSLAYSQEVPEGKPSADSRRCPPRLDYEDPWLIQAGRVFASHASDAAEMPRTLVWPGDGVRIQDPLPRRLLGPAWTGKALNQVRFHEISNMKCKLHVIFTHTHWGRKLSNLVHASKQPDGPKLGRWASSLAHRVRDFLGGKPDPVWDSKTKVSMWATAQNRDPRARAIRLIELLKTIDGMFQQRYFAYPEEKWSWEKYDLFVLSNLNYLLADEFLDGPITEEAMGIVTRYSQLKKLRKTLKEKSLSGELPEWLGREHHDDVPVWLRQFLPVYRQVLKETGQRQVFLIGLLTQTRGCGTPPPLVINQSKEKFLRTVTVEPEKFQATQAQLVKMGMHSVLKKIPDAVFTGLATKSRITVTTSACWDKTRREGGTLGHIHDLVEDGRNGVKAPIRDLNNRQILEKKTLEEFDSPGEYIFWTCLDLVLRTPLEELRYAFLTVVKEPGKGRSVTKARSYLKVVLDLVSKLCAEPLKKGIPSSTSGMGKSHHGWNFFNSLFDEDFRKEIFAVETEEVTPYATYVEHDRTYRDLYVASTDYEEATDSMKHEFGTLVAEMWMLKCGIPPILRGIVHGTCFRPRTIFFQGEGAFEKYGEPRPEMGEGIRSVTLRMGVLMGDPLTKIVLHFSNVLTREIAVGLKDPTWLSLGFTNPRESRG